MERRIKHQILCSKRTKSQNCFETFMLIEQVIQKQCHIELPGFNWHKNFKDKNDTVKDKERFGSALVGRSKL
jgi:hypothetical protein